MLAAVLGAPLGAAAEALLLKQVSMVAVLAATFAAVLAACATWIVRVYFAWWRQPLEDYAVLAGAHGRLHADHDKLRAELDRRKRVAFEIHADLHNGMPRMGRIRVHNLTDEPLVRCRAVLLEAVRELPGRVVPLKQIHQHPLRWSSGEEDETINPGDDGFVIVLTEGNNHEPVANHVRLGGSTTVLRIRVSAASSRPVVGWFRVYCHFAETCASGWGWEDAEQAEPRERNPYQETLMERIVQRRAATKSNPEGEA